MTHDSYAALREPAYRWAFSTHVLMIFAAQLQATAFGWLIYERTQSAAALGIAGLAMFLPVLFLAIPAGHAVDARSRRSVLLMGQGILLMAASMIAILAYGQAPVPFLFAALALSGIGNAFASIARPTIMRDAVAPAYAENGASWSSFGRRISSVLAPITAGTILSVNGAVPVFLLAVALQCSAIACCSQICLPRRTHPRAALSLNALTEGIRFIRATPLVLSATLLDMCAVLVGGATGLLPIFAKDILHVGAAGLGVLVAMPSLGSGAMSLLLAHRPPIQRAGTALLLSVAAFGAMTIVVGLSRSVALSIIVLFLVGAFDAISVTIRATILQLFVPQHLRGRVYGVNMIFVYSSNELGDFESGMVASVLGPQLAVVTGGVGAILIAMFFGWKWRELRELGRMEVVREKE